MTMCLIRRPNSTSVKFMKSGSTDTGKDNIFVRDQNSIKFHMMGAQVTYYTVPYHSFKEEVNDT
jgi:hypothetical protein